MLEVAHVILERYTLGLNFTIELEVVLRKHMQFYLFSDIYSLNFSRGI